MRGGEVVARTGLAGEKDPFVDRRRERRAIVHMARQREGIGAARRTRGDEPGSGAAGARATSRSHTGMNRTRCRPDMAANSAFPAHAGMNRSDWAGGLDRVSVPRTRGEARGERRRCPEAISHRRLAAREWRVQRNRRRRTGPRTCGSRLRQEGSPIVWPQWVDSCRSRRPSMPTGLVVSIRATAVIQFSQLLLQRARIGSSSCPSDFSTHKHSPLTKLRRGSQRTGIPVGTEHWCDSRAVEETHAKDPSPRVVSSEAVV